MGIKYISPDYRVLQHSMVNTFYSWPESLVWTDQEMMFAMSCLILR